MALLVSSAKDDEPCQLASAHVSDDVGPCLPLLATEATVMHTLLPLGTTTACRGLPVVAEVVRLGPVPKLTDWVSR